MLLSWLKDPSERTALNVLGDAGWDRIVYSELAARIGRASEWLRATGVGAQDRVVLTLTEADQFVVGFFAALLAGATPVPLSPPLPLADMDEYWKRSREMIMASGSNMVVVDDEWFEPMNQLGSELGHQVVKPPVLDDGDGNVDVDDGWTQAALLQFTSGSSGTPSAVLVGRQNLETNILAISKWLGIRPHDVGCSWLPLYHDMGLVGMLLTPLTGQNELFIMRPDQFIRDPREWLACLGARGSTITAAPTFGYAYSARRVAPEKVSDLDTSHVRALIVGAERVDPASLRSFLDLLGPTGLRADAFRPAYGLAEATLAVSGVPVGMEPEVVYSDSRHWTFAGPVTVSKRVPLGDAARLGEAGALVSSGRPLEGVVVDVVDEAGTVLPPGHLGEITVRGDSVATRWGEGRDGDHTSVADGFLRTGDVGFIDRDELFVVGRMGDSIKFLGRRVYAEELEAALVYGAGIRPGRCVVLAGTGTSDVITVLLEDPEPDWTGGAVDVLRRQLGQAAVLEVRGVDRGGIQRTTSGKPRRRVMVRELIEGRLQATTIYPPPEEEGT